MRLRHPFLALVVAGAAFASAACGGDDTREAAGVVATTTTTVPGPPVAPLTGLPDESGVTAGRPVLAVKIDNAPKSRPQSGLDVADVVFEEMVEGGSTRFIAVFHSAAPEFVGPIRSVRPMDPYIVSALGGLVAYSGGIPDFVAMMRKASAVQDVNIDNNPSAYKRDRSRRAPHNLYASAAKLWDLADDDHDAPPPALFAFRAEGEAFGEADAASVQIPFSRRVSASYTWDAASGSWLRSQDGADHVANSGARISPENVVVQFVGTKELRYRDQSGSRVTESLVTGEGDAWVFSAGRVVKGRWSKPDATSVTSYTDAAGSPVKVTPGSTWVHYVPKGAGVAIG